MHTFESYPKPLTIPWAKMDVHGYESELIFMSSHTGTHMDAPYHFHNKGKRIHEIPVETFVSDALLLHLPKKAKEYVTKEDILNFEKSRKVRIGKDNALIISTGWEEHSKRSDYLTGNPGLSQDAAEYLTKARMVGIDSANIDHPSASDFIAHNILLPKGVLIVENLCNLKKIKQVKFRFVVLPLKIEGATGSPVRAIALL